jgi:hypothetical protein
MSFQNNLFQPGKILNEVIVGCMRARGTNLEDWCRAQGVNRASAMSATYGRSGGPRGQELLAAMIEAAGPAAVAEAYRSRMLAEAAKLTQLPQVA